jgi:hypothetical protein
MTHTSQRITLSTDNKYGRVSILSTSDYHKTKRPFLNQLVPPSKKLSVTSASVCAFTLQQHYSGDATAFASGWRMLSRGRKLLTAPVTERMFLLGCCRTFCIFWWNGRFKSRVLQKPGPYRTRYLDACARILPNTALMCSNHAEVSWLSSESTFNEVETFLSYKLTSCF